jgi:hypothetical protein
MLPFASITGHFERAASFLIPQSSAEIIKIGLHVI